MKRILLCAGLAAALGAVGGPGTLGVAGAQAAAAQESIPSPPRSPVIVAASGPSVLRKHRLRMEMSSMGRVGWQHGVAAVGAEIGPEGQFALRGEDLYRLACLSCHGRDGEGVPPEIPGLLNAVGATDPAKIEQTFKRRRIKPNPQLVKTLTQQAEQTLRERFYNGGERMPAYAYLSKDELRALMGYLRSLAGIEGAAGAEPTVDSSPLRVGELLVRSTCKTCHDAKSAPVDADTMMRGTIPSLAFFPTDLTLTGFVSKVKEGAPIGGLSGRGRMPLFGYLSEQEVAAAYLYLAVYPPIE